MDNDNKMDAINFDSIKTGDVLYVERLAGLKVRIGDINRGGMGIVYQLIPFDNRFAHKALKTHTSNTNGIILCREADAWFNLGEHINIARPMWFGTWSKRFCLVMDWYPKTLATLNSSDCSIDDIYNVAVGIIAGMDYASSKTNLIHQDIKPSNILIDELGNPKLADFGLALAGKKTSSAKFNLLALLEIKRTISFGDIGGTIYYMAPEILSSGAKPSYKTDMYSLGVTLYEWLTAQHPYAGPETGFKFQPELRKNVIESVFKKHGAASIPIIDLIKTCLSLNSSARPSSYREMLSRLGRQGEYHSGKFTKTPNEIFVQVTLYREIRDYEKAEKLLKEALDYYQNDPLICNTYARLRIYQKRMPEAIELFKRGAECLSKTEGIYNGKPYLEPIMNLAKNYIITANYDSAKELLQMCWDWSGQGKNNDYLPCEEIGWFLLSIHNPENAGDVLLHLSERKKLNNFTLRWFTLALFFSEALGIYGLVLGRLWLETDSELLDSMDAIAMCLCAIKTRANHRANEKIWNLIDTRFPKMAELGLEFWGRPDWYKIDHPDLGLYLAAILDLSTTGGAYAEKYKPFLAGKKLYSDLE